MEQGNAITFNFPKLELDLMLEQHHFYKHEAKSRLISQFNDIEIEASKVEGSYLAEISKNFDPDRHDPSDFYDSAKWKAFTHYSSLCEMRNSVILALVTGMFHQFDKNLRRNLVNQLSCWMDEEFIAPLIWKIDHPRLFELLEWLGIRIEGKPYLEKLNACRMVVNVYKHGEGGSHKKLSARYPEYYQSSLMFDKLGDFPLEYNDLQVSERQFMGFADSITEFWQSLPQFRYESELSSAPVWLETSYAKYSKSGR